MCIRDSCKSNLDKACVRLGDMYWSGRAVAKDPPQALRLYQLACEQDNPTGCYRIGQMYETGADKVPQNIASVSYTHLDVDKRQAHDLAKQVYEFIARHNPMVGGSGGET